MADDGLFNMKVTVKKQPKLFGTDIAKLVAKRVSTLYYEAVRDELEQNLSGRVLRKRTGKLLESWMRAPRVTANQYVHTYTMGSDHPGARILDVGGDIVAKGNPHKYLRFQTEDGQWVQVERVTIPAFGYLRQAIEAAQAKAPELTFRAVNEVKQVIKGSGI